MKYANPTKSQLDYLVKFVSDQEGKSQMSQALWEKVCGRLNSIGPPVRGILQWKKVGLCNYWYYLSLEPSKWCTSCFVNEIE